MTNLYSQLNDRISKAVTYNEDLKKLKDDFIFQREYLSEFTERMLETFEDLAGEKTSANEKIWNLYERKCEEYRAYNQALKNVQYYLSKETVEKR